MTDAQQETEGRWMVVAVAGQGRNEHAELMLFNVSRAIAESYAKGFNSPKREAIYPHPRALVSRVSVTPEAVKNADQNGLIETYPKSKIA